MSVHSCRSSQQSGGQPEVCECLFSVCVRRFEEVGEDQVAFKMINENATKVMEMLDEIRKQKK